MENSETNFFLKSSVLTCVAKSKGAYSTDSFYSNTKDIFLTNKLFPSKKKPEILNYKFPLLSSNNKKIIEE